MTSLRGAALFILAVAVQPSFAAGEATKASARFRATLRSSVADFGGIGDGVSDDTVAWREAVAAMPPGGTLEVTGRLRITAPATVSAVGVRIVGSPGSGLLTKGSPGLIVASSSVDISGIRFDSAAAGRAVDLGLIVENADNVRI